MHINIEIPNEFQATKGRNVCTRIKSVLCHLSVAQVLSVSGVLCALLILLYVCKTHLRTVLIWLETQDSLVVSVTVVLLFTVVSLPISIGYIVVVLADGYLFGFNKGLTLTVIGANVGLFLAHNCLKLVSHHKTVKRLVDNDTARAMMRVISGPLCFKIVFCARLTPIPFGLQNTIFALSNVDSKMYHLASLIGLFPAQMVAVYIGSSLRSMQDVLETKHISTGTYVFAIFQLLIGATLMFWIGTKARQELLKAISEADNPISITTLNV